MRRRCVVGRRQARAHLQRCSSDLQTAIHARAPASGDLRVAVGILHAHGCRQPSGSVRSSRPGRGLPVSSVARCSLSAARGTAAAGSGQARMCPVSDSSGRVSAAQQARVARWRLRRRTSSMSSALHSTASVRAARQKATNGLASHVAASRGSNPRSRSATASLHAHTPSASAAMQAKRACSGAAAPALLGDDGAGPHRGAEQRRAACGPSTGAGGRRLAARQVSGVQHVCRSKQTRARTAHAALLLAWLPRARAGSGDSCAPRRAHAGGAATNMPRQRQVPASLRRYAECGRLQRARGLTDARSQRVERAKAARGVCCLVARAHAHTRTRRCAAPGRTAQLVSVAGGARCSAFIWARVRSARTSRL
jgi:hypothetical protein